MHKNLIGVMFILLTLIPILNQDTDIDAQPPTLTTGDWLIYRLDQSEEGISWILYDPLAETRRQLPVDTETGGFAYNIDGRLAFSSRQEGNGEIYLLDTRLADSVPINITQNPDADEYPLAWSNDGHYLAFSLEDGENHLIYVWNEDNSLNITPNALETTYINFNYQVSWSNDGQLAFAAHAYSNAQDFQGDRGEIFIWDGTKTMNLSQNPNGEDAAPVWSFDGQLAFQSERNGEYDIFVWDGVSLKNGLPDKNGFSNAAPEFTGYYSFPQWTPDGRVMFTGSSPEDQHVQAYLWDGEMALNLSQNPLAHNNAGSWSRDGRWAFTTFWSPEQMMYVRDTENHTLLAAKGQYSPAWSMGGYLMFCRYDRPEWILTIWNGKEITEIARGDEIYAQWQGGTGVVCSSG